MIRVVVISKSDSFVIRGMMEKIKSVFVSDVRFVTDEVEEIRKLKSYADVFVYHVEGGAQRRNTILYYLKDICLEDDHKVILIGTDEDITMGEVILSDYLVLGGFQRPLDMAAFLDCIRKAELTVHDTPQHGEARHRRILIVDDDPTYAMMIHSWLKDRYLISMAGNGMQALKWLATNEVDLILLDYEMPITSGAQVLEMLRSEDDMKDIPVMFLTGKNDAESVKRVIDLKPEGYILKSIMRDDLRQQIADFFEAHPLDGGGSGSAEDGGVPYAEFGDLSDLSSEASSDAAASNSDLEWDW